jgi:hypothetical protein
MRTIVGLLLLGVLLSDGCGTPPKSDIPLNSTLMYRNSDYGLAFSLPATWTGYTVLLKRWESQEYQPTSDRDAVVARGPIVVLRDPRWKSSNPRQDIPILIFTREQWDAHRQEGIFAGGIVYELSRNQHYVFGVYSRFNADDSVEGWEEADQIVGQNTAAGTAG